MSSNSTSGAFGIGPSSGYSLIYIFAIYIYVIVTNACCVKTMDHAPANIFMFVLICLIFRIKINRKMPLIPTDDVVLDEVDDVVDVEVEVDVAVAVAVG